MTAELSNNGGQINVTGADTIENETGLVTIGAGKNSFTNTGTLTVGGASSGTLTLSDDLVTNATGVITVANNGTLDLTRRRSHSMTAALNNNTAARSMSPALAMRSRTKPGWPIGAGKERLPAPASTVGRPSSQHADPVRAATPVNQRHRHHHGRHATARWRR